MYDHSDNILFIQFYSFSVFSFIVCMENPSSAKAPDLLELQIAFENEAKRDPNQDMFSLPPSRPITSIPRTNSIISNNSRMYDPANDRIVVQSQQGMILMQIVTNDLLQSTTLPVPNMFMMPSSKPLPNLEGSVWEVPFPFVECEDSKRRPVLILHHFADDTLIALKITTKDQHHVSAIIVDDQNFNNAQELIQRESYLNVQSFMCFSAKSVLPNLQHLDSHLLLEPLQASATPSFLRSVKRKFIASIFPQTTIGTTPLNLAIGQLGEQPTNLIGNTISRAQAAVAAIPLQTPQSQPLQTPQIPPPPQLQPPQSQPLQIPQQPPQPQSLQQPLQTPQIPQPQSLQQPLQTPQQPPQQSTPQIPRQNMLKRHLEEAVSLDFWFSQIFHISI